MDIDDEDPAWLEACLAAVDNIPVANIQQSVENSKIVRGAAKFSTPATAPATGPAASLRQLGYGRSGGSGSSISNREKPRTSSSWRNDGRRRMRGVGANVSVLSSPCPAVRILVQEEVTLLKEEQRAHCCTILLCIITEYSSVPAVNTSSTRSLCGNTLSRCKVLTAVDA